MASSFAAVVIKLLQGVLYAEERQAWEQLLGERESVQRYCAQIGLELVVHEEDGFAYLQQPSEEDGLPRLTRRIPLSKPVTLLCVLLREELLRFECQELEGEACLVTRAQIKEWMAPFVGEPCNELALLRKVDGWIEQLGELGFLARRAYVGPSTFEVRRILKAKISAEKLAELKETLSGYAANDE
jgi:hypothetical protein